MNVDVTPRTRATSGAISPAAAIDHALGLLAANPAAAERQAREVLRVLPDDARALFVIASARRRTGDVGSARAILDRLLQADPNSAYATHELGLTLAGAGDGPGAVAALRRAAALQADLPDVWLSLSDQLLLAGDPAGASDAYAEHIRTAIRDPELIEVTTALREGRARDAEALLRRRLLAAPTDAPALRLLADVAGQLGHLDDAEELLAQCVQLAPGFAGGRHHYATVLFHKNKPAEAIEQLEVLLQTAPQDVKYLSLLAACLSFIGDFERSIEVLEGLLRTHPGQPKLWVSLGQNLRVVGRRDEAVAAFRRALALNPRMGEAYWSLADLKHVTFDAAEIATLRRLVDDPTLSADDRLHLHYTLGKALEDAADYAGSFAQYAAGARLRGAVLTYDADENAAWVAECTALYTPDFFAQRALGGADDDAPIFIVGLPRSGSTLVEQILGSHPLVEATMELAELIHLANRLGRPGRQGHGLRYPTVTGALSPAERRALGQEYLARARPWRRTDRPRFTDKMPNNFSHIGLIRLILPRARIIDVRRHPMATCFATFKQHFFRGQNFSYDLGNAGRYYRDYVALMDHFDAAQPGAVHRVIYEDLVADSEREVRRLLEYCGLPFNAACLRHWETPRAVSTHSSEQVRRPIFRDALEHWRHYEPWLAPLRDALGPVLEDWRGAPPAAAR